MVGGAGVWYRRSVSDEIVSVSGERVVHVKIIQNEGRGSGGMVPTFREWREGCKRQNHYKRWSGERGYGTDIP